MSTVRRWRSTLIGICVVVFFFAGVTLVIASWGEAGPDVPHAVSGAQVRCVTCHPTGSLPGGHGDRDEGGCRSCHAEGTADAGVPADAAGDGAVADGG